MSGMEWKVKYGELEKDADMVNKYENLREALKDMKEVLDSLLPLKAHYNEMDLATKIEYDIFLAYTMNSLYWVYLRIGGIDPTTTPVNDQLNRTKAALMRWRGVKNRKLMSSRRVKG